MGLIRIIFSTALLAMTANASAQTQVTDKYTFNGIIQAVSTRAKWLAGKLIPHRPVKNTFLAQSVIDQLVAANQLPSQPVIVEAPKPEPDEAEDTSIFGRITEKDRQDARNLKPPPVLDPRPERHDIRLTVAARPTFERIGNLFNLKIVFDPDYPSEGQPIHFQLDSADYIETLRALEMATGSFVVPLSGNSILVAKDTPQKRQELEPNVVVALNLPQTTAVNDLAELARAVQQAVDLQKMFIDNAQRMIVLRGPISKVRPAQMMYEQMLRATPVVEVGVELIEYTNSLDLNYGMNLQSQAAIMKLANNVVTLNRLGLSANAFGLALKNIDLFATATAANGHSLMATGIRSVDGMPATLHIGDRYPIATSGYFGAPIPGAGSGNGQTYRPPPSFNFEDLGLNLKITPHVGGLNQISLDVETEFKVISGSAINNIPIITSRKFVTKVTVQEGEWAVMAGLLSTSEARSISGIPGLISVPILGKALSNNTRNSTRGEALLLLRPRLLSLPPSEWPTEFIATGPEGRPRIPL